MAYSESLANRVREMLADLPDVSEKKMFSGIAFMVHDKMCICIARTGLMCRIDPAMFDELVQKNGVQPMIMKGKEMQGYLVVDEDVIVRRIDLQYWVNLCLAFNPKAQSSKNKRRKPL